MLTIKQKASTIKLYPLLTSKERLLVWNKTHGMWKYKKNDPIKDLKKMRKEWDRVLIKRSK